MIISIATNKEQQNQHKNKEYETSSNISLVTSRDLHHRQRAVLHNTR